MRPKESFWQFIRFGAVGVFCTLLHYGLYYLLQWLINVNIAYTIGYLLSFIANFYLTSYFTFGAAPSWRRLIGMGGAHAFNYLLHMALLNLALWLGVPQVWAPVPVFAIAIPVNFVMVSWVFTHKKNAK